MEIGAGSRAGYRLRRFAVLSACASVGVLSLTDTGWAVRLKAEGYYADLSTLLSGGGETWAGAPVEIIAAVANVGPADVDAYELVVNHGFPFVVEDPACVQVAPDVARCSIEQALPAGARALHTLQLRSDSVRTGIAAVGVLAASDHFDPVPENSFDVTAFEILRRYDVRIELDPESFVQGPFGAFARFRVHNDGPSVAASVDFDATVLGPTQGDPAIVCRDGYDGICGIGLNPALLFPGGWVDLDVSLPSTTLEYTFRLRAMTDPVEDAGQFNNVATLSITGVSLATPIFASGFE